MAQSSKSKILRRKKYKYIKTRKYKQKRKTRKYKQKRKTRKYKQRGGDEKFLKQKIPQFCDKDEEFILKKDFKSCEERNLVSIEIGDINKSSWFMQLPHIAHN